MQEEKGKGVKKMLDCFTALTESGQMMSEIKETKSAMIFLVSVLQNFLKVTPSPRVTYVCGAGARQGHGLNSCGKSKCGLCLFIFRGVRITGQRGRGGQCPEPQHRVVFRWTTYILTTGNTNEKKKERKNDLTYLWPVVLIG